MDISREFLTDTSKETKGVEVPFGDAIFVIARSGTFAYNKAVNALFRRHEKELKLKNEIADQLNDKLMAEVMAKHVLVGWSGVVENGVPLEYSSLAAQRMLMIKDFRAWVLEKANDMSAYKTFADEELSGN